MEEQVAGFLREAHPTMQSDPLASGDLFKDGWLDSLLQLRLLTHLEKEFHVHIPAFQVSLNNFSTISAITALVKKLQSAGPLA